MIAGANHYTKGLVKSSQAEEDAMWLFVPDAFLSFVHKDCKPSEIMVRSRRPLDITTVFPGAKVTEFDRSDYQFRAAIDRDEVKAGLNREVDRIVYSNFKNTIRDTRLHDACSGVWSIMAKLQPKAPYSGFNRRGDSKLDDLFFGDFGADVAKPKAPAKKPDAQVKKNVKKLTRGQ